MTQADERPWTGAEDDVPPDSAHALDAPEAGGTAIRGSAARAAGFAVTTLLGLISAPLLTRHLGVLDFGRYSTVMSVIAVVSLVTEAGLGALAVRELSLLPPEGQRALMRNVLGIRMLLTFVGIALAIAFTAVGGYGSALVVGTVVCGIGAVTYIAQGTLSLPLSAELRLGAVTASEVLRQVVFVAAIVVLIVSGGGVVALLGASIPAGLAGTLLLAWVGRGSLVLRPAFDRTAWRRILRQTLPIAVAGAMYSLYFRFVLLFMSIVAPRIETGYFAVSFRVVEVLVAVPFLVVGSLLPLFSRAARHDQERLAYGFRRTFDVSVVAGAGLTLLTFVGAPLAMTVLARDAASPATEVLRIQSVTLLAVFLNVCFGTVFIALHRHRGLIVVNGLALVVTLAAAAVLVPSADARGGAIAAAIGEWTLVAAYAVALVRARPDLRPPLGAVPRAAIAAAAALAAAAVVDVPRVPNLGHVVVAGIVYVAVLFLVRGVPPEATAALMAWRRGAPAR